MKPLLSILILMTLTISCKHESVVSNNACTAADPLMVPWVKTLTATMDKSVCTESLFQATYNGQTVYYTAITDIYCDYIPGETLLGCEGETVKRYNSSQQQAFANEVSVVKTLYVSKR